MQRFTYTVLARGTGLALRDALVTVLVAGTTELATLYSENSTASEERGNPLTSDGFGEIWAYLPNGRYDLRVDYAGQQTRIIPDVQIFDFAEFDLQVGPLARLTGTGNQLPYFAGVDIAALTDFTLLGRRILAISELDDLQEFLGIEGALTLPLSVAQGGTGSDTEADARTALDVYSKAEVDGLVGLGVPFPLELINGGTGADNANDARVNLDVYSQAEVDALIPAATPYRIGGFITGTPASSELLLAHVATDAFTLPAGLTGSRVAPISGAGVNPAASFTLELRKNGSAFATIEISTSGVVTVTAASATSFAAGDVLALVGPASADASFANWVLTLKGTV